MYVLTRRLPTRARARRVMGAFLGTVVGNVDGIAGEVSHSSIHSIVI